MAFIEEHPNALITVVVDATFGHRIDKKEVKAFDDAVANNELVTPPPAPSVVATPSCSRSPTRPRQGSCRTTRSRSSTATTAGCSSRAV